MKAIYYYSLHHKTD